MCKKIRYTPYHIRHGFYTKACRLFGFQKRGIKWIVNQRKLSITRKDFNGVLVNVDWGLGKTIMSLIPAAKWHWNVLYLCPPDVISHVQNEIKKHFGLHIRTFVATSWDALWWQALHVQIVIMSYHTVARIKPEEMRQKPHRFTTCIIDEIQSGAQKAGVKNIVSHSIHADFFIGLTACQKPELSLLIPFIRAKSYKQVYTFRQPPTFVHETLLLDMSSQAMTEYNKIKQQVLGHEGKISGLMGHKLMQKSIALVSLDKVPHLVKLLEEKVPSHFKVFVVSNFCETLDALRNASTVIRQRSILLNAKVRGHDARQKCIDLFQSNVNNTFLLANLSLVNCGINLGFVDILVIVDPPFHPTEKLELQGRLRRCGQRPKNLPLQYVMDLVTKNTSDFKLFLTNGGANGEHKQ